MSLDNSGITVYTTIRPQNSGDTYPIAHANEIRGGLHLVTTLSSVTNDRRMDGMLAYVIPQGKTYRLTGNTWAEENTQVILGQGLTYVGDAITLDLSSTTLVSPNISTTWSLFNADGVTAYSPAISTSKNIIVDVGVRANVNATYQYPNPVAGQALPTTVSGNFGFTLPGANTPSSPPLIVSAITNNTSYSVNLGKPRSGLVVVGSQVQFASGFDSAGDSISINFQNRSYFGYSTNTTLTGIQIVALGNNQFQTSRNRTVNNVTATLGNFTYYAYPASFNALTNIILDGAAPVLGAFTRLSDVVVTNLAGQNVNYIVYRSNATDAFTNNTLAFS